MRHKCCQSNARWWYALWGLAVVLSELGCLLGAFILLCRGDNRAVDVRFQTLSDRIATSMKIQLDYTEYALRRTAAVFTVQGHYISAQGFGSILQDAADPTKALIESHLFIARVPLQNRTAFQTFCSANIQADCKILQYSENFTALVPAPSRPVYYPIMLMAPQQYTALSGQTLIGLDLQYSPSTAVILGDLQAGAGSSQDKVVVSTRVSVRVPDVNPNTWAVAQAVPSSNVEGFHVSIIRVERLVDTACRRVSVPRSLASARVTDITTAEHHSLLFAELHQTDKTMYATRNIISPGARQWLVQLDYSPAYVNAARSSLPKYITLALTAFFLLADVVLVLSLLSYRRTQNWRTILAENARANSMLSYLNHEVRNPMNLIHHLTEYTLDILRNLLQRSHTCGERETISVNKTMLTTAISDLGAVVGACDMLEHVVTDIMVVQKLEANILPLNPQSCLVEAFIEGLKVMLQQKMEEHRAVIFRTECPPDCVVVLDPFRLKQILVNFLMNSLKYTRSGYINLEVSDIYDEQQKHSVRFSVHDTGCGVPVSQQHKLFTAHSSVNKNDVTLHQSQGLGLYLCKLLATRMQGTVGFNNRPTGGSTFWVQLPFECSNDFSDSDSGSVRSFSM